MVDGRCDGGMVVSARAYIPTPLVEFCEMNQSGFGKE
jgi:hypothetical protein